MRMDMAPIFYTRRLFRVGVPGEQREGPVDLLGEHHPGQFVRKRHRRKRDALGGAARQRPGKTFRRAAKKHQFAHAAVAAAAQPRGKLRGIEALAVGIEQDHRGSRRRIEAPQRGRRIFAQLDEFPVPRMRRMRPA